MRDSTRRYMEALLAGGIFPVESAPTVSVSEVAGLFNIMVGFMFVAAFTTFIGGVMSYFVDFGNQERLMGIKLMEWGVAILFVLVVLLGAAEFIRSHPGVTNVITAVIIMAALAWVALTALTESPPPPKKESGGAPPGA